MHSLDDSNNTPRRRGKERHGIETALLMDVNNFRPSRLKDPTKTDKSVRRTHRGCFQDAIAPRFQCVGVGMRAVGHPDDDGVNSGIGPVLI
jgi:hypothetical protein